MTERAGTLSRRSESPDDEVLEDVKAFLRAASEPQKKLFAEAIQTIGRLRREGHVTNEEAEALLRGVIGASVGRRILDALLPLVSPISLWPSRVATHVGPSGGISFWSHTTQHLPPWGND